MDYNIYIHNVAGKGGKTSQTKAWGNGSSSETTSWNDKEESTEALSVIRNISSVASNPDSLISAGVGAIAKAVPWVAGAMIVASMVDKTISTVESFVSTETGDYRFGTQYSNFKRTFSNILSPASTVLNVLRTEQSIYLARKRNEQTAQLLGDISINNLVKYGV
jgi:hypothetical protein